MAAFFKFNQFVEDLAKGVHNLDADSLKIYLTNAAPSASADAVKADLADLSTGGGYTAGGAAVGSIDAEQTAGTLTLSGADVVFTATAGGFGPFQYAVLYNDTPTSPADPLIGAWDYGSAISLNDGDTFTVDLGASILTIA